MELINVSELYINPFFLSLIILLFSILIWLKPAKGKKLNLPPSPPKLPIIGNIHQLGKLPHRSLRELSRNYGSLMLLQLGHTPTLVVSSAEMAKEITKDHDPVFSSRPSTTPANMLFYGCTDVGFAPYGEYWRQVRKICVVELLSARRVNSFQFVRDEEVELVVNKIRRASVKAESINLTQIIMSFSNNVVSRCAINRKVDKEEDEDGSNKQIGQSLRKLLSLLMSFCIGDMFPYLKWMDVLTGLIPSMKATSRELNAVLDQIIEDHKALNIRDEIAPKKDDFVSIILQLQKDDRLDINLNEDNIKAILLDMFLAGTDSTAVTIEWMMSELLKHPNIMEKVQEEVRNVVGTKSKVDVEDISKMEYLKCVIKETLRLHPAGPLLVPRQTTASVKVGGYDIPSDVKVFINAWAIQTDPNWWEKPEEFIPERFVNNPVDFKGQDFHFIPFGCGRRGCPGIQFAVASIELVFANLLYWFDWKLSAGETADNLDMSEVYGLSVTREFPPRVVPVSHFSV